MYKRVYRIYQMFACMRNRASSLRNSLPSDTTAAAKYLLTIVFVFTFAYSLCSKETIGITIVRRWDFFAGVTRGFLTNPRSQFIHKEFRLCVVALKCLFNFDFKLENVWSLGKV